MGLDKTLVQRVERLVDGRVADRVADDMVEAAAVRVADPPLCRLHWPQWQMCTSLSGPFTS